MPTDFIFYTNQERKDYYKVTHEAIVRAIEKNPCKIREAIRAGLIRKWSNVFSNYFEVELMRYEYKTELARLSKLKRRRARNYGGV